MYVNKKAIAFLVVIFLILQIIDCQPIGPWKIGRATYYGTGAWSIHHGACNYNYLFETEPLGWDVAAMANVNPLYPDSCGTCYEVACLPSSFQDGYGKHINRNAVCYNQSTSLVVRIVDSCNCIFPANEYSNRRWCCGDMDQLDLSIWAFEKLADIKWGVIGMKYRRVNCTYQPIDPAPLVSNPTPGTQPPANESSPPPRDWPEYWPYSVYPLVIFNESSVQSPWQDYSYAIASVSNMTGIQDDQAYCRSIQSQGAISFQSEGSFQNRIALDFWVYAGSGLPQVEIVIGGPKGDCMSVQLLAVTAIGWVPTCTFCTQYWQNYCIYFPAFSGSELSLVLNNPEYFYGCGDNSVPELTYVEFRNNGYAAQTICLDNVLFR